MLQRPVVQRQRIGPAIRKLRHEQALTLDDLAAQAGISASHLSRLERGQTLPSFTVLAGIAHVLGVSIDEFAQLEQDVTVLDRDLGEQLTTLGLDDMTREEYLSLSIESRRVLASVLAALAASPISPRDGQDQAVRAVMERGLVEASQALGRIITNSGLSPVGFTRALIWLNTAPGQKRLLLAKPGLIGMQATNFAGAYRTLTGSEPLAPEISAWWQDAKESNADLRAVVSIAVLKAYMRDGTWIKGGPSASPEERAQFGERLVNDINNGDLEIALTDESIGDINMRISEDDVLLEATRHRGAVEQLGLIVRGRAAADTFGTAFEGLWNKLPANDKDPETVKNAIRAMLPSGSRV